jgi:hypothetical protein
MVRSRLRRPALGEDETQLTNVCARPGASRRISQSSRSCCAMAPDARERQDLGYRERGFLLTVARLVLF